MADPKAPELPKGWTRDAERNAARFKSEHRAVDVELTHEELCVGTQENYRGSYDNTSAFIPLPLLLEMLAAFEFHLVSEADKRVLEQIRAECTPRHMTNFERSESFRRVQALCSGPWLTV
jgi:hypothetical protein